MYGLPQSVCRFVDEERLRIERLLQISRVSGTKNLEGDEFSLKCLPLTSQPDKLTSCQFVRNKKNLVLYIPIGLGNIQSILK
jgi:hypothetical protein